MDELRYFIWAENFYPSFHWEGGEKGEFEKREFRCIVKRSGEGKIEMQVKQNSDEDRKFNRFIIKIVRYLYEVKKHLIILLHFITLNKYIV